MSPVGICQLIISLAALAAFLINGIVCFIRGDEFANAVIKASISMFGIVIVLRFFSGLLQGVWVNSSDVGNHNSQQDHSDTAL